MPSTTNFGWTTPADTDLVKDGASAIRTLGNGIDTSFVDLKGGTTGQILSKASNTDLDFSWVTSAGDIEGVTAGTGISGGGTSGTVTITNSMATAIDAKGDLIVGTGADTFSRLAVGTNDQVLVADSSTSTGLKWAAASAGKVLQVVSTTTNSETFSQSATYADVTNASLSITPSAATSKVLVLLGLPNCEYRNSTSAKLNLRLTDGSNTLISQFGYELQATAGQISFTVGYSYLDSPATTSSKTYKVRLNSADAANGVYVNRGGQATISIILMEIGA